MSKFDLSPEEYNAAMCSCINQVKDTLMAERKNRHGEISQNASSMMDHIAMGGEIKLDDGQVAKPIDFAFAMEIGLSPDEFYNLLKNKMDSNNPPSLGIKP